MTGEVLLILRIFVSVSLFIFLGWVVWVFWRELQTNVSIIASRKHTPLALQIDESLRGVNEKRIFEDSEITVGRDPTCELHLEDEIISAHHARFSFHHSQWWLEDLHSTNGTKLNGDSLETATVVIAGDVIVCGNTRITLIRPEKHLDAPAISPNNPMGE